METTEAIFWIFACTVLLSVTAMAIVGYFMMPLEDRLTDGEKCSGLCSGQELAAQYSKDGEYCRCINITSREVVSRYVVFNDSWVKDIG